MPKQLRQECIDQVSSILNRKLTPSEGRDIVSTMKSTMGALRRQDPNTWARMTRDQRISAAGQELANQIREQGKKRAQNLMRQAIAQDRLMHKMNRLETEDVHAYSAVAKILNDVYANAKGITNEYLSDILDTINGIRSEWFGFVENKEDVHDFVYEAFGHNTGNERASLAWKAFSDTSENMRQRAVAAGADIGKLDYGYLPQSHDRWKVLGASRAILGLKNGDSKKAWTDFILPLLDRERYVNSDGELMSDGELREVLSAAFDDIVTSGSPDSNLFEIKDNKPKVMGSRFKKYHHRTIHFKDADSYIAYEQKFGKGSLTSALVGHVGKMANDIAILEVMGSKPKASYEMLKYVADRKAENAGAHEGKFKMLYKYSDWQGLTGAGIDDLWNVLTGVANRSAINREGVANFMSAWRNLEMAGKLGKAFITSLTDIPSYFVATRFNHLPLLQGARFFFSAYGSDWKDYAARAGIIAESLTSDFNRWSVDNIGEGWTAKISNVSMRASLLNAFTDGTRRAFSLNMMSGLAKLLPLRWDELSEYDRLRFIDGGLTEKDWRIFQMVGAEEYKGVEFLTMRNIKDFNPLLLPSDISIDDVRRAPAKLLSYIISESEMASLGPDLVTRAETTRGAQRGTFSGEVARSLFLFKSFPIAMMEKHFRRAEFLKKHGGRANQLSYAAGMIVMTTIFGAISLQVQNLLNGKDLQDVESSEFWLNALTKGGGLGFLGDFIANGLSENSRMGAWGLASLAGPQVSTVVEGSDLLWSVVGKGLYDKDTKPGARAVRLVRSHMPFVNLWYTSTAIDRAFMNELQDYLSPGYTQRMQRRMYRSWGHEYWWGPRDSSPRRSPRMATMPDS